MIVDERMVTYIRSLERPENPVIEAIEHQRGERRIRVANGRRNGIHHGGEHLIDV